jgi:hypothetical protein
MPIAVWGLEEGGFGGEAAGEPVVKGRLGEGGAGERESWGREVEGRCIAGAMRVRGGWACDEKASARLKKNCLGQTRAFKGLRRPAAQRQQHGTGTKKTLNKPSVSQQLLFGGWWVVEENRLDSSFPPLFDEGSSM